MLKENVRQVEDFDTLKCADVVWLVGCERCGANHRLILLRAIKGAVGLAPDGQLRAMGAWLGDPRPKCCDEMADRFPRYGISRASVEAGRVWVVVDPAQQEARAFADGVAMLRALTGQPPPRRDS
jgi:hypothetical protein